MPSQPATQGRPAPRATTAAWLVMPTVGGVSPAPGPDGWKSGHQHAHELMTAGYHKVLLDRYGITAEITSTARAGFHRWTFARDGVADIFFDLHSALAEADQVNAQVTRTGDTEIEGWAREQARISKQIKDYQQRIDAIPGGEREYVRLTRDYNLARTKYQELMVKSNQSEMANELEVNKQGETMEVLEAASLPQTPTEPNRWIIVTAGSGLVQSWDSRAEKVHPGDVVWMPPNEKHWHGAAPTTAMTHLSIVEQAPGKTPNWMEKVSEEQYRSETGAE